ncbi:CHASE domain-containing protein [Ramlibacter sp. MMS24-I3-19]|uniref:CHASE domain-containing protein n=1 Tax=Ramlibacter sp. MMS24-I3-19 TaxID=3416606 RepID=UPI003D014FDE
MKFRPRAPDFKGLKHLDLGLVPLAVLLLGVLLTAGAIWGWMSALDAQERGRFTREAETLQSLIDRHMTQVANSLGDIAAMHAVTGRLDASDLRLYWARRGLGGDDSGLRGFGVIEHLRRDQVAAFEASQRRAGVPAFAVRARANDAPDLFVVRSLEPSAQNNGALGFDVGSIPAARAALEHAVDTGEATFTEPLTLLQDERKGLGMVLYLPIYRGSPRTAQDRRNALELVVFAPIVAREMLGSAVNQLGVDLNVWLYDETDGGRQLVHSQLLGGAWTYLSSRPIVAGGRAYIVDVAAGPRLRPVVDSLVPWAMAILGLGLTLALALLTRLVDRGRTKALVQVDSREQFLRTITDHMPARISYWDREGRCLFANLRFREVFGIHDLELSSIQAALAGRLDESSQHEQLVLQGMPQQFEQDLVEASGRRSTWQVHYIPDFAGDVVQGYFALATEVTELKKARDLALRASNAKTQFLATMSHEIRTPMTGVLGMVDLLEQEDLPPHVRKFVDSIRVSGRHLLHIINDILDFSRLQSGRLQLEEVTFSMPDVIEQVRSIVAPLASERQLAFSCDIDPAVPQHLRGDPTRLRQVLLNIVGNAVKFTERGSVSTSVAAVAAPDAQGSARLRFQVQDTGIGIAPEYLRHVFEAFDQADNSIARRYGGSGLGLAISQQLVRAMEGEITVESQPGQGSRFWFEIPFQVAQAPETSKASAADAALPPARWPCWWSRTWK